MSKNVDRFGNDVCDKCIILTAQGMFHVKSILNNPHLEHTIVIVDETSKPCSDFYVVPLKFGYRKYVSKFRVSLTSVGVDCFGNTLVFGDLILAVTSMGLMLGILVSDTQMLINCGMVNFMYVVSRIDKSVWRKTEKNTYKKLNELYNQIQGIQIGKFEPKRGTIYMYDNKKHVIQYYLCLGRINVYENKVGLGEQLINKDKQWGYLRLQLNTNKVREGMSVLEIDLTELLEIFFYNDYTGKIPGLRVYKEPKRDYNVGVAQADLSRVRTFYVDTFLREVRRGYVNSDECYKIELV